MSALEQEIISKLQRLDESQKVRVLKFIDQVTEPQRVQTDWFERVNAFQVELRAKYGDKRRFSVQDLLDEVREERLDDLLGSR
jgi:hypothetical protein